VALVLDTGPLLAALDAADPDHSVCASLITEAREDLLVPALVLAELDYWCHKRLGGEVWISFLDDVLAGAYRVEPPIDADLRRCRELQATYLDLRLGITDASVIALVERFDEPKVATLDHRHFGTVRPQHVEALNLVPRTAGRARGR
jgi:predicted nucleic acid-binding protein